MRYVKSYNTKYKLPSHSVQFFKLWEAKILDFKHLLTEKFLDCFVINEYLALFHCLLMHSGLLSSLKRDLSCSPKKAGSQDVVVLCIPVKLSFRDPLSFAFSVPLRNSKAGSVISLSSFPFKAQLKQLDPLQSLAFKAAK